MTSIFYNCNIYLITTHLTPHTVPQGAPDVLLDKCSSYLAADGSIKPVDATFSSVRTYLCTCIYSNLMQLDIDYVC